MMIRDLQSAEGVRMMSSRTQLSLSDEWATSRKLFDSLCETYHIDPKLDVSATFENRKCLVYMDEKENALTLQWMCLGDDVWCNPPNKKTKAFVLKAHEQWKQHNINIMMLVPSGVLCRNYFEDIYENYIKTNNGVEWHPVRPRPIFSNPLQTGKQERSKNDYIVIIWRRKRK